MLVAIDQMGREFLRRLLPNDDNDPLFELWPELEQAILRARLEDEETSTTQGKLVRQFARHLEQPVSGEPRWVGRLRSILAGDPRDAEVDRRAPVTAMTLESSRALEGGAMLLRYRIQNADIQAAADR
jgi:hypothetical protein